MDPVMGRPPLVLVDRARLACLAAESRGKRNTAWRLTGRCHFRRSIFGFVMLWVEETRFVRVGHPTGVNWPAENWRPRTRVRRARIHEIDNVPGLARHPRHPIGGSPCN